MYSYYCAICMHNVFQSAQTKIVCSRSVRSSLPGHLDFGADYATQGKNKQQLLSLSSSYLFQLLNQPNHDDNKQYLPVFRRKLLQIKRARSQTCLGSRPVPVNTKLKKVMGAAQRHNYNGNFLQMKN